MKQLLSIFIAVLVAITAFGQTSPPNKLRSNDSFTQVDNYLVAAKRLGIPSGPTPTLDASTTPGNSTKLFYDTDDESLMVYDPVSSAWSAVSVDLSEYWTRTQVDSAINATFVLERIDEGGRTGWALRGRDPNLYGNIGSNAIDYSASSGSSSTRGATGSSSLALGVDVTASGTRNIAMGRGVSSTAASDGIVIGSNSSTSGTASVVIGYLTNATADEPLPTIKIGEPITREVCGATMVSLKTPTVVLPQA